jgi:regulator of extracellular matrix RemA (YlzA/DUF370 family)
MNKKSVFSVVGLFIGALLNVLFNLIAAAIQQRALGDQFSDQSIWWLVGSSLIGLLFGYWISSRDTSSNSSPSQSAAIRATNVQSKEGGLIADDKTGRGVEVAKITTKDDILLSSKQETGDSHPKEHPPT